MSGCHHPEHHHPEHPVRPVDDPRAVVEEVLARLRPLGLRRTKLLEAVLDRLARGARPTTIGDLGAALSGPCDPATLYRMIERLVQAGVVRRLGLHDRALYYELVSPGRHRDYLICTGCGAIGEIGARCPVSELEAHLAASTGYADLRHELVFYGLCPECRGS